MRDRPKVGHSRLETNMATPHIVVMRQYSREDDLDSDRNIRSHSFRNEPKPNVLKVENVDGYRRRSMPNALIPAHQETIPKEEPDLEKVPLQRVRSFKTTSKGHLINRGDSFRRQSTDSNSSLNSLSKQSGSRLPPSSLTVDVHKPQKRVQQQASAAPISDVFQVSIIGASRVGKTALKRQFMTSEYTGDLDSPESPADGLSRDAAVPVLLDDEESIVMFTDKDEAENCDLMCSKDAIVVVYAVNDRKSFNYAIDCLFDLRQILHSNQVIILVANKSDIVRSRVVSAEEGKRIAEEYKCKYIETSSTLNHRINELLCGIIKQIRLFKTSPKTQKDKAVPETSKAKSKPDSAPRRIIKSIVRTFTKKQPKKCENLYEA